MESGGGNRSVCRDNWHGLLFGAYGVNRLFGAEDSLPHDCGKDASQQRADPKYPAQVVNHAVSKDMGFVKNL